jgi:curved DNA-binding protein
LQRTTPNHYATLGLDRRCTADQIRQSYRVLAKQHHPDLNPNSTEAKARTQELNAAYETLSDPDRRRAYDEELNATKPAKTAARNGKLEQNISQDVHLRIEEFFRGASLEIRVNDPGNPDGPELYPLDVPPGTAAGARFRIRREGGGHVLVRVRARPDFRFKIRGSDLRCDLRISAKQAAQGGFGMVAGPTGNRIRVQFPAKVGRGEVVRIDGEGLPKPRGGRGDLLIRIVYQPEVQIARRAR